MLSSAVRCFADPDDFAAAIRQSTVQLTVTGHGQFTGKIIRIDLHRLWMQRFSENLPLIAHSDSQGGRAVISFRTQPGPSLSWGGAELRPENIIRHRVDGSSYLHSSDATNIGAMSLPLEDTASVGAVIAGCDLTPPPDALVVTPQPAAMAKLQRLHAAAGRLAEVAPEVIAHPEAARGLEQALIDAMIGCLTTSVAAEERSARRRHEHIMRRFHELIEKHLDRPLYVPEICRAIKVSAATLRACCHDYLGMSPKQYLLARRMHLVRRDLCRAAPGATTVTEVALRYGFWQFGRFAGAYQASFGELPSAALGRTPQ
jgi:AraC-like DNA-binding protein